LPSNKQESIPMADDRSASRQKLIERLEDLVREKFPANRSDLALAFVHLYYTRVRIELLQSRELLDLYGGALAHLGLARRRQAGEALVRVYNPTLEKDGWESPHTVAEIVVEDMPFLVDSARMAVNRRDLQVLRIIHPVMSVRRDGAGHLTAILSRNAHRAEGRDAGVGREAVMHLEILRQTDGRLLAGLKEELLRSLEDLRRSVEDWHPMRAALARVLQEIQDHPPPLKPADFLHRPPTSEPMADLRDRRHRAFRRLAFEELVAHQLGLRRLRRSQQRIRVPVLEGEGRLRARLYYGDTLPFTLI
jgi:glutamate dehydrogenase